MAQREYRVVMVRREYYPQVHAGWQTLWRWRYIYMDNAYASRACPRATVEEARAAIRHYERQRHQPSGMMVVVEYVAPDGTPTGAPASRPRQ